MEKVRVLVEARIGCELTSLATRKIVHGVLVDWVFDVSAAPSSQAPDEARHLLQEIRSRYRDSATRAIERYFPRGMKLDQAEKLLRAAG
jgi:hypothetical protein